MNLNFEHISMEELKNIILEDNETFDLIYYNNDDVLYIYSIFNLSIVMPYPIHNFTDEEEIEIKRFIDNLDFNDVNDERKNNALKEFYARMS